MKRIGWQIPLGVSLLALSALFYFAHYLVFKDARHIFIYLVGDIAFVFVEVLLVTLIIHRVLEEREKRARLEKLNMVIGAFFSQVGTKLLETLSRWDPQVEKIHQGLAVERESFEKKFKTILRCLREHDYDIALEMPDWNALKTLLAGNQDFLLRLLENPTLLEHESFTDLLRAVFHLAEELQAREDLQGLPDSDCKHLRGDIKRVYRRLAVQWLQYMKHLKSSYPYLFSLSMRTNPFDRNASPVVQDPQ